MRVFSAEMPNMTYAKLGDLCCSTEEFSDFQCACTGIEFLQDDASSQFLWGIDAALVSNRRAK
jgi:hypothetical protein